MRAEIVVETDKMATVSVVLIVTCLLSLACSQNTTSCFSASECPSYKCCQLIKIWPQVGRRAIQGECRPMRTQGQSCWVKPGTDGVRPNGLVTECPCEAHLRCVGIGAFVNPYGEAGNCGYI